MKPHEQRPCARCAQFVELAGQVIDRLVTVQSRSVEFALCVAGEGPDWRAIIQAAELAARARRACYCSSLPPAGHDPSERWEVTRQGRAALALARGEQRHGVAPFRPQVAP